MCRPSSLSATVTARAQWLSPFALLVLLPHPVVLAVGSAQPRAVPLQYHWHRGRVYLFSMKPVWPLVPQGNASPDFEHSSDSDNGYVDRAGVPWRLQSPCSSAYHQNSGTVVSTASCPLGFGAQNKKFTTKDSRGGGITAAAGPDGTPPRFGLDAARTVLRFEESCEDADRALAGRTAAELVLPPQDIRAVYDLAGSPQVDWQHPVGMSAAAAAADASGQRDRADELLDAAARLDERDPTYYGSAWAALGRVLLRTTLLNECARTSP